MESFVLLLFLLLAIGAALIPGIIASRRNHAYKGVIWALSALGIFSFGIGWIIALIWALWPADKTLIDPLVGNTTGIGKRNSGNLIGETRLADAKSSNQDLESQLGKLKDMLESQVITEQEYEVMRKKVLGI
jgi:hypothetical protein